MIIQARYGGSEQGDRQEACENSGLLDLDFLVDWLRGMRERE